MTTRTLGNPITNIQDKILNKKMRSSHPATKKAVEFLRMARRTPAKRQEYVEKALALLPKVPSTDNVQDLAQKIRDEACKDLNRSGNPNYTRALKAVKICNRILAPEISEFMVMHAGSGPEGILRGSGPGGILLEKDIKKELPRSNVKNGLKEEQKMMELMLSYSGM